MSDSTQIDFTVRTDAVIGLNAFRDEKVIEICSVQWGLCVLEDDFKGQPGSTLHWDGTRVQGKQAFAMGSTAYRYLYDGDVDEGHHDMLVPCYSYTLGASSTPTLTPGNISFEGTVEDMSLSQCEYHWITSGTEMRTRCLETYKSDSEEDTAVLSFVAAYYGYDSVPELLNAYFDCGNLINTSHTDLKSAFIENSLTLRIFLNTIGMYGNFFETSNEYEWMGEAANVRKILQMMDFVDSNTRTIVLYLVSRNLGKNALFYTMTAVKFRFLTSGKVFTDVRSTYVPIVQYYYGLDGYPWLVHSVAIFEAMFLVLYLIFFVRESRQLLERITSCLKSRVAVVSPIIDPLVPGTQRPTLDADSPAQAQERDRSSTGGGEGSILRKTSAAELYIADHSNSHSHSHDDAEGCRQDVEIFKHDVENQWPQSHSQSDAPQSEIHHDEHHHRKRHNEAARETGERRGVKGETDDCTEGKKHEDCGLTEQQSLNQHSFEYLPDERAVYDPLDWLTIGVLGAVIFLRVDFVMASREIHSYIMTRPEGHYDMYIQKILQRFTRIGDVSMSLGVVYFIAIFIGFLQFFRYVGFSRQMAIVTETIQNSARQLAPVLLIFTVVLSGYAVLGNELYGHVLQEWSSLSLSITTLFMLILGDYTSYYKSKKTI
jgi:hypothetical protein